MVHLGRWSWIGHGTKIRAHEGEVRIGAKTVLGQECTISAFQHVSIGRECIVADRVMLIDFDHGVVEVERPIRLQGIYKRDVRVGHNVWIGYGACFLRGVTVGDNAVVGHQRRGHQGRRRPTPSSRACRRGCCACATRRGSCAGSSYTAAGSRHLTRGGPEWLARPIPTPTCCAGRAATLRRSGRSTSAMRAGSTPAWCAKPATPISPPT